MNTPRTAAQHLASRANLRQQRTVPLSDEAAAKLREWRAGRVELTPTTAVQLQWGMAEKGSKQDER